MSTKILDPTRTGQTGLLVLTLDEVTHALRMDAVREVIAMVAITPLPTGPGWLAGVINLRGEITPVVDLRTRIGATPGSLGLATPIVIVEHEGRPVGLIADAIDEIVSVEKGDIHPADGLVRQSPFVGATAQIGSRLVLVLDEVAACEGTATHVAPTP